MKFSPTELERYDRQIRIKGLGKSGRLKLKRARVMVAGAGGLEEFGWAQVTYDLSAYAGQSIYVYFAVANWYDTLYKTWCYIGDVSVTYGTCNVQCWIANFISCLGYVPDFELACLAGCAIAALGCGPFFPACVSYCFAGCGIIGDVILIGCAITAVIYCCL